MSVYLKINIWYIVLKKQSDLVSLIVDIKFLHFHSAFCKLLHQSLLGIQPFGKHIQRSKSLEIVLLMDSFPRVDWIEVQKVTKFLSIFILRPYRPVIYQLYSFLGCLYLMWNYLKWLLLFLWIESRRLTLFPSTPLFFLTLTRIFMSLASCRRRFTWGHCS